MQKRIVFFPSQKTSMHRLAARGEALALLVGVLLATIISWPAVGHAQSTSNRVASSNGVTTVTSHHRTDVFMNTANLTLWHRWNENGTWSDWEMVVEPSIGDVAVAMNPDGISMTLFIVDGAHPGFMWRTYFPTRTVGQWGPWNVMPFVANYTNSETMKLTTGPDGTMYFVALGFGNGDLRTSFLRILPAGGSWSDWIPLASTTPDGRTIMTLPAIASSAPGNLQMLAIDNTSPNAGLSGAGHLWTQSYINGQASGWQNDPSLLGLYAYSFNGNGISMIPTAPGRIDGLMFDINSESLLHNFQLDGKWQNIRPELVDNAGNINSYLASPGVTGELDSSVFLDVYAPNFLLEHKTYTNGVWSAWTSLGAPDNTSLSARSSPVVVGWMAPDPTPTPTPTRIPPTPTPTPRPSPTPNTHCGRPGQPPCVLPK